MRTKLVSTLWIWGGMAISAFVIPGQIVPILLLGFMVGFVGLHLSILAAKPASAPAPSRSHVRDPMGGTRFLYGIVLFLLAAAAFLFWELWRGWASLEGHVVLASTALYLPALVVGVAFAFALNAPKMASS